MIIKRICTLQLEQLVCLSAGLSGGGFLNHTHPVGLLWRRDRIVRLAATYKNSHIKYNKHPCLQLDSNSAISKIKRLQTYALDRTAAGIT
jgi:hypothetical protein